MHKVTLIEGIGSQYADLLHQEGIDYLEELLSRCSNRQSRKELSSKTGISAKLILKWANQADLSRIKGVGEEFSELLEKAGVDTVKELALRNPHNLYLSLINTNNQKHLVRHMPSEKQVSAWIHQARRLPRVLKY